MPPPPTHSAGCGNRQVLRRRYFDDLAPLSRAQQAKLSHEQHGRDPGRAFHFLKDFNGRFQERNTQALSPLQNEITRADK
jgi:hypothetical protein